MNKFKAIIESLKDLRPDLVNNLFDSMIQSSEFDEGTIINENTMFIFPDGRLIEAAESPFEEEGGMLDRYAHHEDLYYQIAEDTLEQVLGQTKKAFNRHPVRDLDLSKFYNLIFVAVFHQARYIIVPENVEPTEQQLARLREAQAAGFVIESGESGVSYDL